MNIHVNIIGGSNEITEVMHGGIIETSSQQIDVVDTLLACCLHALLCCVSIVDMTRKNIGAISMKKIRSAII